MRDWGEYQPFELHIGDYNSLLYESSIGVPWTLFFAVSAATIELHRDNYTLGVF